MKNKRLLYDVLAAHQLWVETKGAYGKKADLTGADLTNATLIDAALTGANLRWADLTRADLTDANLTDANLTGAVLTNATLTDADLTRADLTRAALRWADLTGADLTRAVLRGATGNGKEIRSAQICQWPLVWTADVLCIGCQQHSISEWEAFTDEEIAAMHSEALPWWKKNKSLIMLLVGNRDGQ